MSAPVAVVKRPLNVLATDSKLAHKTAGELAKQAIDAAYEAGTLLIEAKAQVKHGEWLNWLEVNCPAVAVRTAQQYMALVNNRELIESKSAGHAYLTIAILCRLCNV